MVTAEKEMDRLKDIISRLEASNERRQKQLNEAFSPRDELTKAVEERDGFVEERKTALATAEQKIRELEGELIKLKDRERSHEHSLANISRVLTSNPLSPFASDQLVILTFSLTCLYSCAAHYPDALQQQRDLLV